MGVGEEFEEEEEEVSWQYRKPAIGCLVGGLAVSLVVCFICLVVPTTTYVLKSKCSPLEDPKLEEFGGFGGKRWRTGVRVEVINHRDGLGASLLARDITVYNSADGAKSPTKAMEQAFASSHCLCPGCDGVNEGTCHGCVPRSPGCQQDPPEYACYVVVRNPDNSYPHYSTGVEKVVFEEDLAVNNDGWTVALIVFGVLSAILLVINIVVYLPGLMGSGYKDL
mmetsp:Transcript_22184/g.51534  ORF Transcript_22184/g.51534 Transcript_22184/m.51534 type:complete len:223 (+) Transcript_22184:64-732(+)